MTDYLLTEDEVKTQWTAMVDEGYKGTVKGYIGYKILKLFLGMQDRKSRRLMLEQLEKEGLLSHDEDAIKKVTQEGEVYYDVECLPDCRACVVLREVGK